MKRSVIKALWASGFLLLGTGGWAQSAAQMATEGKVTPQTSQLTIVPNAARTGNYIAGETSTANPADPTREASLFLHIKGLGGDPNSEQVSELFYGFEGIYNDGGMQIMGIKGDTREVFAQRIQVLRNHPKVESCQLDEFGDHLTLQVSGLSVASVLDLIINVTSDQR